LASFILTFEILKIFFTFSSKLNKLPFHFYVGTFHKKHRLPEAPNRCHIYLGSGSSSFFVLVVCELAPKRLPLTFNCVNYNVFFFNF
jgi:hypothetical protein